jgi:hypothetical protein
MERSRQGRSASVAMASHLRCKKSWRNMKPVQVIDRTVKLFFDHDAGCGCWFVTTERTFGFLSTRNREFGARWCAAIRAT